MDFVTIDFETATSERNSPCEIGLTFVKDSKVVDTKSWLIKPIQYPYFDDFNMQIHGIYPEDVADQPSFKTLWYEEIQSLLEDQFIIAHNAGFDISVLRRTLETYKISFPSMQYSCSYIFSKKVWAGLLRYDLKSLCLHNDIPLQHHRAAADSLACAALSLRAFEIAGVNSIEDFPEKLRTIVGQMYNGGYKPSLTKTVYKPKENIPIVGDPAKHNPESIFYRKSVVFTGALSSMVRAKAHQIIADIGGFIQDSVTKDTDVLIVGQQDFRVVGEDGMSNKQEKAQKLLEKGATIEVISEDAFLRNI